ncbi:unnamed protein product [Musa banksii]
MSPSPPQLVHHRAALLASPLNAAFSFNIVGAPGPARRRAHRRLFTAISAMGGEETRFEVDPSKAREALQRLDQQLESLAQQEALPKKKRPSPPPLEPILDRDLITGKRSDDMPEVSGSYLAYTAVALVLLTVLNNILFNVFIKPSVDGNEQVSKIERVPLSEPTEQLVPKLVD